MPLLRFGWFFTFSLFLCLPLSRFVRVSLINEIRRTHATTFGFSDQCDFTGKKKSHFFSIQSKPTISEQNSQINVTLIRVIWDIALGGSWHLSIPLFRGYRSTATFDIISNFFSPLHPKIFRLTFFQFPKFPIYLDFFQMNSDIFDPSNFWALKKIFILTIIFGFL